MERQRFQDACDKVLSAGLAHPQPGHSQLGKGGIGTLGEKTIHAVLKLYLEPDETRHEVRVGGYIADICRDDGIIEIQTKQFHKLRDKLEAFLAVTTVTVVYPLSRTRYITWVDRQTGEAISRRKSPKGGTIQAAFPELYKIKGFLAHPNLRLHIVFLDMEEYRYQDSRERGRRRGAAIDRIPMDLAGEVLVRCAEDYRQFVPPGLGTQFTSRDFAGAAKLRLQDAQTALNVLHHLRAVRRVGKRGNLYVYERESGE